LPYFWMNSAFWAFEMDMRAPLSKML